MEGRPAGEGAAEDPRDGGQAGATRQGAEAEAVSDGEPGGCVSEAGGCMVTFLPARTQPDPNLPNGKFTYGPLS